MIIISKYDPLWKWINKNKPDEFLVMTGIGYGNNRLLSLTRFYLYHKKRNQLCMIQGDDYGNKKYYFETSHGKRNVTRRAGR